MKIHPRKVLIKSVFILTMLLGASALSAEQRWEKQVFRGEEAIDHLKGAGQYESLGEAIRVAHYSVREVESDPKKVWAQNRQHDLSATFDSEGLHLKVQDGNEKSHQSNWRLESAGGSKVTPGELRRDGQRVEIVRPGLTEWFINRPTGLEHGFTLAYRPAGAGDQLQLSVAVEGDLIIAVSRDGQRAELQDKATGMKVLDYDKLRVWDATGRELAARMAAAKDGAELQLVVEDADARYPLTIDPTFTQEAFLKASNADEGDEFGSAVAVSGDTVVIGAIGEASSATGGDADDTQPSAGAVYVFVRRGTTWSEQAILKADNAELFDDFGSAVAISGDTIVVGARREDSSATGSGADNDAPNAGAVYVFVRSGTAWSQQAFLKADNGESSDEFGISVAVDGDTIVVGSDGEDSSAMGGGADNSETSAGAAYVFVRNGTTWSQQAMLKADNAGSFDKFGVSVGLSGDTIVVGAEDEESSATGGGANNSLRDVGAAYVFVRSGTTWSQQAFLKAANAGQDDEFGASVAVSGNLIVIGAPREDSNGIDGGGDNSIGNSGAAYIFVRSGTTWSQDAMLKVATVENGDAIGQAVAISGRTVVLGSDDEDGSATGGGIDNDVSSSGAAYVFEFSGTTWRQVDFLKASNIGSADRFGVSVAVSDDLIIVGADQEDSSATGGGDDNSARGAGAAYIFQSTGSESSDIEITAIEVDALLNAVALTWRSTPGFSYRVDYSLDLVTWVENLVSGIAHDADGEGLTSQDIDLNGTALDGTARWFLRVVEE